MDLGLKDKVAVIGASSKGLGKAIALGLAAEGAKVTICARDADTLEETAAEIRALFHSRLCVGCLLRSTQG